jgi:hypothetical protein
MVETQLDGSCEAATFCRKAYQICPEASLALCYGGYFRAQLCLLLRRAHCLGRRC